MENTTSSYPISSPASTVEHTRSKDYLRFDLAQRISHVVMLTSFTLLAITGLPQKFIESPLSLFILRGFGGIEATRQVHHVASVVLMLVSIFHVIDLLYRVIVLRTPLGMLPWISDIQHVLQDIGYYLGLRKHKAFYGRYSYAEKAEYLAVVWGTVLMAITGFMMWNPIVTARYLPGQAIPAAKAAHGGEAVLAVLAILLWHFYHVHIKIFNKSIFTGKITRLEMEDEHPAELAEIESGRAWQRPPADIIRKRQRVFVPIAGIFTVVFSLGLVGFITVEDTAITTIPTGESAEAYVPVTPTPRPTLAPTPTPIPGVGAVVLSWQGTFQGLFRNRCGTCHGRTAVGGLTLETYQSALQGGNTGSGVIPGDPEASFIVKIQSAGNHPGQLTADEIKLLIEWITVGAPEQ